MGLGIDPGQLRDFATLQENLTQARDAGGGFTGGAWTDFPDASDPNEWVRLLPLSAAVVRKAAQLGAPITHTILMRWRSDVTAENRVRIGARIFELTGTGVDVDSRQEFLRFDAVEDLD